MKSIGNNRVYVKSKGGIGTAPTDPDCFIHNINQSKCNCLPHNHLFQEPSKWFFQTKPWEKMTVKYCELFLLSSSVLHPRQREKSTIYPHLLNEPTISIP